MVRLRPELFFRFILLTGLISLVFIGFFTVRHQTTKENRFQSFVNEEFISVLAKNRVFVFESGQQEISADLINSADSDSTMFVVPDHSHTTFYLFWSPWSEKSKEILFYLDKNVQALGDSQYQIVALSVKESRNAVLESLESMDERIKSKIVWVDGTDLYGKLAIPGIPTLIFIGQDGSEIHTYVGVSKGEIDQGLERIRSRFLHY